MRWWGWGSPDVRYPSERLELALRFLETRGIKLREAQEIPSVPSLPPSRLRAEDLEALEGALEVSTDDEVRISRSLGKGYLDLLKVRLGRVEEFTDAVAFPRDSEHVRLLLETAASRGIAVVPYGGGTSVLGGLRPLRGRNRAVVTVDLRHLNKVLEVDEVSLLARVEAGVSGPELEEVLGRHNMTLGHFPQSFHFSTLGGWIATRASGHLSGAYGRIENMVQSVSLVTPQGTLVTKDVPARSAGPELRELVLGSEGAFGIITEAVVRVRRSPEARARRVLLIPGFTTALDAARGMIQSGIVPSLLRISNEDESSMIAHMAGLEAEEVPSIVLLGFDGTKDDTVASMETAVESLVDAGALDLGEEPALVWEEEYYTTPYLRDDFLARGLLVDTLETAASWRGLQKLYVAVRHALLDAYSQGGVQGLVLCHLSHTYRDGGSLYYTLIAPREQGKEVEQWWEIKRAATEAIMRAGGTISHHHGVGTDHLSWILEEHGETALMALKSLKIAVDPKGIMNPGKVVREE